MSLAVLAGVAAVAYADWVVVGISLSYLYLLPLALSALIHRNRYSLGLVLICVFLHDWLGPFKDTGWEVISRNLLTAVGYTAVVLSLHHLARQRLNLSDLVRQQRDQMAQDLALASEVQQHVLLASPPSIEGFDLAGQMYPARLIGGDYFDFFNLPGGDLGFAIADISGKGASAALLAASTQIALRMAALPQKSTAEVMKDVNRVMLEIVQENRFISLFYGILSPTRSTIEYSNAGHNPPLLLTSRTDGPVWLDRGGTLLGLFPAADYGSEHLTFHPGDILVLYTDGVVEAENVRNEQFSSDRLLELVRANRSQSAARIASIVYQSVADFSSGKPLADDCTLVVLKRLEATG